MYVIYEAENSLQAHMLRALLEQRGIDVHITGEYLLGAMGDLPARGLVRVLVPADRAREARTVVHEFEDNLARDTDASEDNAGFGNGEKPA